MTYSPELEGFLLPLSESDGRRSHSARTTSSVGVSSSDVLIVSAGFPCQDLSVAGKGLGFKGTRSSLGLTLIGSLSKTSGIRGADGCPSCGASYGDAGIPVCRFECKPLTLDSHIAGQESLLLPTPTASSYGSCRGGGSGRVGKWRQSLQSMARHGLWPTPAASDYKGSVTGETLEKRRHMVRGVRLPEQVARRGETGPLNPEFVELLMGFPIGHTELRPSVTPSFQQQPNSSFEESRP